MTMLNRQWQASLQRGLPVEEVNKPPIVTDVAEASVALQYYNSGVLTADAGQAISTVVIAKLQYGQISDEIGFMVGAPDNTSLGFTSTALTTEVDFPWKVAEGADRLSGTRKAVLITENFADGEYCVDYRTGTLYGVKASTTTALTTVTYKVSTSLTSTTIVDASGDSIINIQDAAVTGTGLLTMLEAADFDGSAMPNTVGAEGDAVTPKASLSGISYVMLVNEDGSAQPATDTGTDTFKIYNSSPLSDQHAESTLVDNTNETDATTYYYVDMDGYNAMGAQLIISGGSGTMTVTVEGSLQDDGTAASSCTYGDISTEFGAASWTATTILQGQDLAYKYLRFKTVSSTGGSDDADITIYFKKLYS